MTKKIKLLILIFISALMILAWWSSLTIGLSSDEYFHHINGLKRYNFLVSFGEDRNFQFRNNDLYPGLYDTISYTLSQIFYLINKNFYVNNIDFVMHFINVLFSSLSLLGLYIFTKKILDKNIALLSVFLTLANPFFFGHMGMNSKDTIIFFSLIWSTYFFYIYFLENEKIKHLILGSIFVGFGCGVRLPFLLVVFPVILSGFIFLICKYRLNYLYLIKKLSLHVIIFFTLITSLVMICWPHFMVAIENKEGINFLLSNIERTLNFEGPRTGLINGQYYEVFNSPKTYFLKVFVFRFPIYFLILIFLFYALAFYKKKNNFEINSNLFIKFFLINIIIFFPIIITIIFGIGLYDNIRLFLFIIPFLAILGAFSLNHLINFFNKSVKLKFIFF
ncbi:Dolichyl-phosphate-mannose-protein mannosyltransferase [alpha proteobacterium HIMB5]|nr:Dolichyl-phosphate-mannose-protein mannosyltransferase [alpha proteobacterium HIMB5]